MHPSFPAGDYQNYTLAQVAAMCCARARSRLECALDFLEQYRSQRDLVDRWLDEEIERLDRDCGEPMPDGLDPLRPDSEGQYVWDRWQAQALEAGLSQDLAGLGRAVMREAVHHAWTVELKASCGWRDNGQAMRAWALRDGAAAAQRWRHLLETDGLRGRWTPEGEWQNAKDLA